MAPKKVRVRKKKKKLVPPLPIKRPCHSSSSSTDSSSASSAHLPAAEVWWQENTFALHEDEYEEASWDSFLIDMDDQKGAGRMTWEEVQDAVFAAHVAPIEGRDYAEFCYAGNKKREVQRIKRGSGCAGEWQGLTWENEKHLYVRSIGSGNFCVGTWYDNDVPISRIMPKSNCKADGFVHDFSFKPLDSESDDQMRSSVFLLCVGKRSNGNAHFAIGTRNDCKRLDRQMDSLLGSFPVWIEDAKATAESYDVCDGDMDSQLVKQPCKTESCCPDGWTRKFSFSLPRAPYANEAGGDYATQARARRSVCVGENMKTGGHKVVFAEDCSDAKHKHLFKFDAPSLDDIAFGLITLIQEGLNCPTFLCPDTLALVRDSQKT